MSETVSRITLNLRPEERGALDTLAAREFRDTRGQAHFIVRRALEDAGLLHPAPAEPCELSGSPR